MFLNGVKNNNTKHTATAATTSHPYFSKKPSMGIISFHIGKQEQAFFTVCLVIHKELFPSPYSNSYQSPFTRLINWNSSYCVHHLHIYNALRMSHFYFLFKYFYKIAFMLYIKHFIFHIFLIVLRDLIHFIENSLKRSKFFHFFNTNSSCRPTFWNKKCMNYLFVL